MSYELLYELRCIFWVTATTGIPVGSTTHSTTLYKQIYIILWRFWDLVFFYCARRDLLESRQLLNLVDAATLEYRIIRLSPRIISTGDSNAIITRLYSIYYRLMTLCRGHHVYIMRGISTA